MSELTGTDPTTGPWTEVPTGHALRVHGGELQCRNAKGRILASVPPAVKRTEEHERLAVLVDSLTRHRREQVEAAEAWMLRGAVVPVPLLAALWEDPDARAALHGLLVQGTASPLSGLLLDADAAGLEVADADGGRHRMPDPAVVVAHPALLEDADRWWRALVEHGLTQAVEQLQRQVFRVGRVDWLVPAAEGPSAPYVLRYAEGSAVFRDYARLMAAFLPLHAELTARHVGVRVREGGQEVLARVELEGDSPEHEHYADRVAWFAPDGRRLTFEEIGPVAWSEGVRLARRVRDVANGTVGGED